jgi:hypothetical protein
MEYRLQQQFYLFSLSGITRENSCGDGLHRLLDHGPSSRI